MVAVQEMTPTVNRLSMVSGHGLLLHCDIQKPQWQLRQAVKRGTRSSAVAVVSLASQLENTMTALS